MAKNQHERSIQLSSDLFNHALQGLRYLQTYDWLFLRALITIGYLGWITYGITTVIDMHVLHGAIPDERTTGSLVAFSSILVGLYSFFIIERSPVTYYGYAFFPVFFWEEVFARRKALSSGSKILLGNVQGFSGSSSLLVQAFLFLFIIEGLVSSSHPA